MNIKINNHFPYIDRYSFLGSPGVEIEPYLSPRIDDSINRLDETIQTLVHSMADLDERIRELGDKVDQIDYQKGLEDVI